VRIELHWRLFRNPHSLREYSIMTESRAVPVRGGGKLRTLGEDDLFAYLCVHGARHSWNRLKWLADINALLATIPEENLDRLLRAAEARGAGRAVAQAMLLCQQVLGTPLAASVVTRLEKGVVVRWLVATAQQAMTGGGGEHNPHEVCFGTTRGSISTFLLSRSWRYKMVELNLHLTNPTDVLDLSLPERLRFLYPVLRLPRWAWRHAVKRRRKAL
jgi:hypothetical protein